MNSGIILALGAYAVYAWGDGIVKGKGGHLSIFEIGFFNTLFASNQADPTADGVQLDGFVAADDETAKATVLELVESIGLNPVDVGPLKRARQLEGLAFLNITLNAENGGAWQSGWKLVGAPETVSAETTERGGTK